MFSAKPPFKNTNEKKFLDKQKNHQNTYTTGNAKGYTSGRKKIIQERPLRVK